MENQHILNFFPNMFSKSALANKRFGNKYLR
jgi:hypothetical protein